MAPSAGRAASRRAKIERPRAAASVSMWAASESSASELATRPTATSPSMNPTIRPSATARRRASASAETPCEWPCPPCSCACPCAMPGGYPAASGEHPPRDALHLDVEAAHAPGVREQVPLRERVVGVDQQLADAGDPGAAADRGD